MIGIMGRKGARLARAGALVVALAGLALSPVASAQVRTIDPNTAIDADLAPPPPARPAPTEPGVDPSVYNDSPANSAVTSGTTATGAPVTESSPPAAIAPSDSYQQDDLIGGIALAGLPNGERTAV